MKKDELRHDPVRENIIKGVEYIGNNKNTLFKVFIGVVFLVAAFSYYNYTGSVNVGNAAEIAGLAQNAFINGETDEAMVKFERVLVNFPRTFGAVQSLVYLVNDAVNKEDYEAISNMISKHEVNIGSIDDPIVEAAFYKIQGDIALLDGNTDYALSFYRQAESSSKDPSFKVKYQLDVISILINQTEFNRASKLLSNILNIDDVGYNEKNKAEELLAFVNQKLGT